MAAESSSAAVILASSHLGFALSTTQVATGSILGSGIGKRGAEVRWRVAGRMVVAWLITLADGRRSSGAVMWYVGDAVGGWPVPSSIVRSCSGSPRLDVAAVAPRAGEREQRQRRVGGPGARHADRHGRCR